MEERGGGEKEKGGGREEGEGWICSMCYHIFRMSFGRPCIYASLNILMDKCTCIHIYTYIVLSLSLYYICTYVCISICFFFLVGAASVKYCRQGLKQTAQDSIQSAGRSATQKLAQPANYETNEK